MGAGPPDNQTLTIQGCVGYCGAQNYTVAGMEWGVQCCKSYSSFICVLVLIQVQSVGMLLAPPRPKLTTLSATKRAVVTRVRRAVWPTG